MFLIYILLFVVTFSSHITWVLRLMLEQLQLHHITRPYSRFLGHFLVINLTLLRFTYWSLYEWDHCHCVNEVLSYLFWEFLIHCLQTHNQDNTNNRQGGVVFSFSRIWSCSRISWVVSATASCIQVLSLSLLHFYLPKPTRLRSSSCLWRHY